MKYIIIISTVMVAGCVASRQQPEFKPLPPERLFKNVAEKTPSTKDYEQKEYN